MRFILALLVTATALRTLGAENLILGVGSSRDLKIPVSAHVTISNGQVLKAADLGHSIRLTGRKKGQTTVKIGDNESTVQVLSAPAYVLYKTLQLRIKDMRGLQLDVQGDDIRIKGRLLRFSDWRTLAREASANASFTFNAEMSESLVQEAQAYFNHMILSANLPLPALRIMPALVSLALEQKDLNARFEKILGPYGFTIEKNSSVIEMAPIVRVQISITELRKNARTVLGVQWPESYQAQVLPVANFPGQTGNPLTLQLNALEQTGQARILASPNILCRSGNEASFLAGGEFPIKLMNFKTQDVIWKKYGVLMNIKPKADFSGRMSIGISTEVSTIDPSQTVDGIPALLTNRIESYFDLLKSRTIILSGLLKKESSDAMSGLPGLAKIPILGALFSSDEFREHQTELVVFVTPEVIHEEAQ